MASITLNKHEISASIKDRYANIVYSFDFENSSKNGSSELKFEITIDPNAFISKFSANIDGELFVGETKEKETASKEYSAAKEKDENAILISQPHENIPNVFEIKTNIDSKSKIFLTIQIEQYLQKKIGFNQFIIQILRNFSKYNIRTNFDDIPFKLSIEDNSGIQNVDIPIKSNKDIIINEEIMDKMNRKCQINGKITGKSSINELSLKYKIKGESDESYILFDNKSNIFCHIISDIITDSMIDEKDIDEGQNQEINNDVLIPRRIMFVIDRSGSMSGSKWEKTISSTIMAIKQLRNGYDRFGIILFDHSIKILPYVHEKKCILADDKSITDSIKALENAKVGGSTNINDALLKAIKMIKDDILSLNNDNNYKYNFFMNQIIFITDGEPNSGEHDTNKIITNVQNVNNLSKIDEYNKKICIFSFGVGNNENDSNWIKNLNHSFLKLLSVNNNGFYQRIKRESADTALGEYFKILSKPVLSNINIEYKNKNIKDLTKTKFNTLYSGNDLIICGKIENAQNLLLNITATTGKEVKENDKLITKPINISKEMKINITPNNNDESINNIERIWAYLKLQQFATEKLIYNDMIEMDEDEEKEKSALPLSLALKYKFVTPWTSMIVVKKKEDKMQENEEKKDIEEEQSMDEEQKRLQQEKAIKLLMERKRETMIEEERKKLEGNEKRKQKQQVIKLELERDEARKRQEQKSITLKQEKKMVERERMDRSRNKREQSIKMKKRDRLKKEQKRKQKEDVYIRKNFNEMMDESDEDESYSSTDSDSSTDSGDVVQSLKEQLKNFDKIAATGQLFLKYTGKRRRKPSDRIVKVAFDNKYKPKQISWGSGSRHIFFNEILYIAWGHWTPVFQARKDMLDPKLCFSVVGKQQILDLQSQSKEMTELWVKGLRKLIGQTDEKADKLAKQALDSGNLPGFNDNDDNDDIDDEEISDSMKRIMKELKDLQSNPISNCLVQHDKTIWKASINGLKDTPYEGGIFYLDIEFPNDYPLKPPKFTFITKIYHCNINENGEINLDLLNNKWSPAITISKILSVIMNLLINPNVNSPLMPDIAKLYKEDKKQHDKIAKEWTEKYANTEQNDECLLM